MIARLFNVLMALAVLAAFAIANYEVKSPYPSDPLTALATIVAPVAVVMTLRYILLGHPWRNKV